MAAYAVRNIFIDPQTLLTCENFSILRVVSILWPGGIAGQNRNPMRKGGSGLWFVVRAGDAGGARVYGRSFVISAYP